MRNGFHTASCESRLVIVSLAVLAALALISPLSSRAQDGAWHPRLTLKDIHARGTFAGENFENGQWDVGGSILYYLEKNEKTKCRDLLAYKVNTEKCRVVARCGSLRAPDVDRLIAIEDYALDARGGHVLIFTDSEPVWRENTKGFYYVLDLSTNELRPLSSRSRGYQMFAKFDPAGERVAFVRNRNLFVYDLETGRERALTTDGTSEAIINGTFDWVYEEEFGLRDGWEWSPDGTWIAFVQLDESDVQRVSLTDLRGRYPEQLEFAYPKAGDTNSDIRIGIIDVDTGERRFYETGTWGSGRKSGEGLTDDAPDPTAPEYLIRLGWLPPGARRQSVWMLRMNRAQNRLELLYADVHSSSARPVLSEKSSTWIAVPKDKIKFAKSGKTFVWLSEKSGYNHAYLYASDGSFIAPITSGKWDVTAFHGLDETENSAYFTGTLKSELERHLYSIDLPERDGRGEWNHPVEKRRRPTRLTPESGWHWIDPAPDLKTFIDKYSSLRQPPVWVLRSSAGRRIKMLESNDRLKRLLTRYRLPGPHLTTVPASDGSRLNALIMRPTLFDPGTKYPLLMHVYGGPGSQIVRNAWGGTGQLWHSYMAEELGMIVVSVDGRGTGGRGKDFKDVTHNRLGVLEALDQISAARHFAAKPYIDHRRIGIWGWSFGGYATLMSMLTDKGPSTFAVGVAVAPVTDWRLHDTVFTERYMSLPRYNKSGYRMSSPVTYARRLSDSQDLLIMHGDLDDNVHFQHSVQLIEALQSANRSFDFMMYPGKTHSISGGLSRLHLFSVITEYFRENL